MKVSLATRLFVLFLLVFPASAFAQEQTCMAEGEARLRIDRYVAGKDDHKRLPEIVNPALAKAYIEFVVKVVPTFEGFSRGGKVTKLIFIQQPDGNVVAFAVHGADGVCTVGRIGGELHKKAITALGAPA